MIPFIFFLILKSANLSRYLIDILKIILKTDINQAQSNLKVNYRYIFSSCLYILKIEKS